MAAQRVTLIDAGILQATLSDRMSAATIGTRPSGAARADGFARQPIVRMTNVSIEPGDAEGLDELLDGVREGIYMETNRSWSIDDQRLHFQFGTEIGREIRDGKLGRLVRNPTYAGVTPRFWGSLDAVANAGSWRLWGLMNCGKGEPGRWPSLPRRRSGALSRRRGGRARVNEDSELALDAALALLDGDESQATVTHERSLATRFARSTPTQATAVEQTRSTCSASAMARPAQRGPTASTTTGCAPPRSGPARATTRRRGAAPASTRACPTPAGVDPCEGFDPATAALDPAQAAGRAAHRLHGVRLRRPRGVRALDRRRGAHGDRIQPRDRPDARP